MQTLRYGGEQRRQTTMTKQICINSCLSPIWKRQQMTPATVRLTTSWRMKQPLERKKNTTGHCFLFVADIMADYLSYRKHNGICCVSLMSSHASEDSSYRCALFCFLSGHDTSQQSVMNHRHTTSTRRDNVPRAEDTLCSRREELFI